MKKKKDEMVKEGSGIASKIVKKILRTEAQEISYNFDNIELRIVESKRGVEEILLGTSDGKSNLFFTEEQLIDLYESLSCYFKRRKNE